MSECDGERARRIIARTAGTPKWQPIESAPKDGSVVLLLSAAYTVEIPGQPLIAHQPKVAIGKWWPDGDSWVDEYGMLGRECYTLAVTGVWESGGGWFQPNEVTHWMPLPSPPQEPTP